MSCWSVLAVSPGGPQATALPPAPRPLLLVFPATLEGETLTGATAAANGAAMLGRIVGFSREGQALMATRTSHGGRIATSLRVEGGLAVATANDIPGVDGEVALGESGGLSPDCTPLPDQRIALDAARIVIGGGRGLDAAGFALLEQLAEAVGGAVGASLPAVDLGLAPISRQVGQSGKFVSPEIYFAVGLSGTPQHLAGIGRATRLIAIDSDPEADIFRFAEAGAVGDARVLLPLVVRAVQAAA